MSNLYRGLIFKIKILISLVKSLGYNFWNKGKNCKKINKNQAKEGKKEDKWKKIFWLQAIIILDSSERFDL